MLSYPPCVKRTKMLLTDGTENTNNDECVELVGKTNQLEPSNTSSSKVLQRVQFKSRKTMPLEKQTNK